MINHIEGHENLTTKDLLFMNLKAYCDKSNTNMFDIVPFTLVIDYKSEIIWDQLDCFKQILKIFEQNIDSDYLQINKKLKTFQVNMEKKAPKNHFKISESQHDHKNIWLLKPTGFNRGRGIHIFRTFEEFKKILRDNYDIQ